MIKLVKLINNEEKIKKHNDLCEELKNSEPNINWEKVKLKNINDRFSPYELWLKELGQEKTIKTIKDTMKDINNIYISNLNWKHSLQDLTDYKFVNEYNEFDYGVCDNASQVLDYCNKEIQEYEKYKKKKYIAVMTPIFKSSQDEYGWRWHKWGSYIGVQNPQHEYLADEKNIDMIYVFQVKEVIEN
ncbi:hypothetical protein [Clostridium botulinum]|uniref:hypothetical protein n=1 Tax=Clostridium botulinum TaxID=1491 RepID=UPI0007745C69|nr:hypothetical protein [Clostridium botulinum]MBN3402913.1 hypothetical protein [Clostridium botulinum]MBN3447578.1 hypothetical protein [Clostridium botulinum]